MSDPWLTIVGLGEDGPAGLTTASHEALARAEVIFGGPRHLALAAVEGRPWGVPFDIAPVLAMRGRRVVVLASGDPFWFGAGGSLIPHLAPGEWVSHPAPSTFALAANRLGWRLEEVLCLGLHAAPLTRLTPILGRGTRAICLMRDAAAVAELATYLAATGFGASTLTVLECLGGPRERIRRATAHRMDLTDITAPVAVAIDAVGQGIPRASGLPDALFAHDGQITKRPVRALTLSALAPRAGETLWDIGAGSGSIGIEWLLAGAAHCHAMEADTTRATRARANADRFGLSHRYTLHQHCAPEGLATLARPDAVFIGGGASEALLTRLWDILPPGTRLVANAVTLETEALLLQWSASHGGDLLRIELAEASPLGGKRGWRSALPIVQWSVVR
ncbi:precorrin-6y C5,15-methyltransferase (decarboxylating) subunit CbiE [Tabrizicola sp.]|uniref:precorrin-6y C5,15-methyltransferase (decarboxylating) subunit CbiE n=1 Tax=Tabrizicola sp. TaxID=2005166 RepID=UPI00286C89EC|nr:precorrin-6y C5,15-methyltransferase (decarboxylating) subunit CbiE [Tabrizicola sp.]